MPSPKRKPRAAEEDKEAARVLATAKIVADALAAAHLHSAAALDAHTAVDAKQFAEITARAMAVHARLEAVEKAVNDGNKDTAEILSLLRASKMVTGAIKWTAGVGAAVVAIVAGILTVLHFNK